MNAATTETDERHAQLEQFAASSGNGNKSTPSIIPMAGAPERVFGAQAVAVYRDEARILQKIAALGAAAGDDWFYRFPVKTKGGGKDWIEGPSIKLANDVARIYGNCDVDVRVFDLGDSWVFYARFTDFETGYSLTRPFQQRKSQSSMNTGDDRRLDIAFQIGTSKAIRNVVVNALQTYADYAFSQARNSLVSRIEGDLPKWRDRTVTGIANMEVDLVRVEKVLGRAAKDWLAPDVAKVIAMMKAIADGMATKDETFPLLSASAESASEEAKADQSTAGLNKFSEGDNSKPASTPANPSSPASGQPVPASSQAAPPSQRQEPSEGATAGAGAAPAKDEFVPGTEAQYLAYANAWRDKATDKAEAFKRWKGEKELRNKCNVSPEIRDALEKQLDAKFAEAKK